jgi:hypothetical protein
MLAFVGRGWPGVPYSVPLTAHAQAVLLPVTGVCDHVRASDTVTRVPFFDSGSCITSCPLAFACTFGHL